MKKETGWSPLPISIKVVFVVQIIGTLISFFSLFFQNGKHGDGFVLFGFHVYGILGICLSLIMVSIGVILLISLWKRVRWAWILGIYFYSFGLLNTLFLLPYSLRIIEQSQVQQSTNNPELINMTKFITYLSFGVGILLGFGFGIFYIVSLYRNRSYFKQ